jgi:hypothetical protein
MLRRRADGQLRPAAEERDIADVWADQRRIRLKQEIEEEDRRKQRRALKQQRKQERKKLGWRAARKAAKTTSGVPGAVAQSKDIEIRLSLPKLPKFHWPSWDEAEDFLANLDIPDLKRVHAVYASCAVTVIALLITAPLALHSPTPAKKVADAPSKTSVLGAARIEQPPYTTLLPKGKTAQQLGGWGRVSPKTSDPVYAYADRIGGISITVSEQPLPDDFTADPQGKIANLAKQFNATKPLVTGADTNAFIGTSVQGLQSIVATKQGLLLLIRSVQPIHDSVWGSYLDSLN